MKSTMLKSCIFFLCILLLSTSFVWATETDDPIGREVLRYEPNLRLSTRFRTPSLEAGKDIRLAVPIDNIGQGEARNIYITMQVDDPDRFPFEVDRAVLRRSISSINGSYRGEAPFHLTVRGNAASGLYSVPFRVEYTGVNPAERYAFSDTLFVRVENPLSPPGLVVDQLEVPGGRLQPGTSGTIRAGIKNSGDLTLRKINITLEGLGVSGLFLDSTLRTRQVGQLEASEITYIDIPIRVEAGVDEGTYGFRLEMAFEDSYGKKYETVEEVFVPVSGSGFTSGVIAIENLQVPATSVEPYTDFPVSFKIRNTSDTSIDEILVQVDGGEALLPKSPSRRQIHTLRAGETAEVDFVFFAKEGIESRNYPLEIRIEPAGSGSGKEAVVQYAGVLVGGIDNGLGVPKIIIDQYGYSSEYVPAGTSFPLTLSFFNTHTGQSVRNIRISLTSEGDVFSPVGSSNTFFVQHISPGGRTEKQITLRSRPDADYKIHNLYADIEYEDETGTERQVRELIGIPVVQEARLVFGEVETGMEAFVGNPVPVSLEFYNAGRGRIRNLIVSIEGDFDTSDGSLYIGNVEAGASNYYDATLFPTKPGTMKGSIIFEYDDEIDTHHVIEKSFSIEVMEMMAPPEDFYMEEMNTVKSSLVPPAVMGGGGIAAAIGGIVFFRRRKKRNGEVTDDE